MSKCLNDAQVRAAADNEAGADEHEHLNACGECRARVDAARSAADELASMTESLSVPASLCDGSLSDVLGHAALRRHHRAGATTLRDSAPFRSSSRWWLMAGAAAASILVVVFVLPPPDAPRAIAAAEILDRSLQALTPTSGIELREFELDLQLPGFAAARNGKYRIEQLVDHDTPGRYRAIRYAADGTLLEGISEEPAAGRRTVVVTVDGQPFAFRLSTSSARVLALRDLERHHIQAVIRLLQATAGQAVQEIEEGGAKRYVIELPPVGADANASGLWELTRARAVIDESDFQIVELTAAGSYLGDAFSVAFRLQNRQVWSSGETAPNQFELPAASNAITIEGPGTDDVARDLLAAALRELAGSRR
jgi:hypothetical protein